MRYPLIPILITFLFCVNYGRAGENNPGPNIADVKPIWTDQGVTTAGLTSTNYYKVGADETIIVDLNIHSAEAGSSVEFTPLWELPGGNYIGYPVVNLSAPNTFYWTEGVSPTSCLWEINPPRGAAKMYINAGTSDTSEGVTVNVSATGIGP